MHGPMSAAVRASSVVTLLLLGCSFVPAPAFESDPPTPGTPAQPQPVTTPEATADPWAPLFRPVSFPALPPGDPCPTTTSTTAPEAIGPVLGDGPIYPAFLGPDGLITLTAEWPVHHDGQTWRSKKVLWVSDDSYGGIALVRGFRIDGPGEILFSAAGGDWVDVLRLTREAWVFGGAPRGWREWNSGSAFNEPGCYAYQVDGETFTDVIVIRVNFEDAG